MTDISLKGTKLILKKPEWTEAEITTAECLGFHVNSNKIVCDMRGTNKKSLAQFMKKYYPNWAAAEKKNPTEISRKIGKYYFDYEKQFLTQFDELINYPKTFFEHQTKVLALALNKHFNFLGLDMGLGKTIVALTISKMLEIDRTIIICPAIVKVNWFREATEVWDYEPMYWTILDGKKAHCMYAYITERFIVINYEQIGNFMEYLTKAKVGHIICDEIHLCRNSKTKKFKMVSELSNRLGNPRITMLSGTPIVNRVNDLFAYLKLGDHFLGQNYSRFDEKYVRRKNGKITSAKNIQDLKFKLSNCMVRLRSEDCLDLPPINITKYYFKMDDLPEGYSEQLAELKERNELLHQINDDISVIKHKHGRKSEHDLAELKRLRYEKFKIKGQITGNLHTLNRLTATSKVPKICEVIDNLLEQGEKVVVFATYHAPLDELERYYKNNCVKIDGRVDSFSRDKLIHKFTDTKECTVFLGQTQAAGVGINLVNSNHVFFCNFTFTSDQLDQSIKRLNRPGATKRTHVYYTLAENSVDEKIFSLVKLKLDDINEILDKGSKGVIDYSTLEEKLIKELLK